MRYWPYFVRLPPRQLGNTCGDTRELNTTTNSTFTTNCCLKCEICSRPQSVNTSEWETTVHEKRSYRDTRPSWKCFFFGKTNLIKKKLSTKSDAVHRILVESLGFFKMFNFLGKKVWFSIRIWCSALDFCWKSIGFSLKVFNFFIECQRTSFPLAFYVVDLHFV